MWWREREAIPDFKAYFQSLPLHCSSWSYPNENSRPLLSRVFQSGGLKAGLGIPNIYSVSIRSSIYVRRFLRPLQTPKSLHYFVPSSIMRSLSLVFIFGATFTFSLPLPQDWLDSNLVAQAATDRTQPREMYIEKTPYHNHDWMDKEPELQRIPENPSPNPNSPNSPPAQVNHDWIQQEQERERQEQERQKKSPCFFCL